MGLRMFLAHRRTLLDEAFRLLATAPIISSGFFDVVGDAKGADARMSSPRNLDESKT